MPIFEGYGALKSFFSLLSNVFKAMFQVHFLIQEKKQKCLSGTEICSWKSCLAI